MKISIIAALSENRVIGRGDKIPWHVKEDLIRFKNKTAGHVVIIGRKTYESLLGYYQRSGRPFPKRIHIIVTHDKNYQPPGENCYAVTSIEKAIELAKEKVGSNTMSDEVFIAGGAEVFKQTIDLADKLYLTIVKGNYLGDKYFPTYEKYGRVVAREKKREGEYEFEFLDLEKG